MKDSTALIWCGFSPVLSAAAAARYPSRKRAFRTLSSVAACVCSAPCGVHGFRSEAAAVRQSSNEFRHACDYLASIIARSNPRDNQRGPGLFEIAPYADWPTNSPQTPANQVQKPFLKPSTSSDGRHLMPLCAPKSTVARRRLGRRDVQGCRRVDGRGD